MAEAFNGFGSRPVREDGEGGVTESLLALIEGAEQGNGRATEGLFATLYTELHRVARRELARNRGMLSLSPTTVLHQAYIDMAARDGAAFPDRARFLGYAARVMRGLIIDHARSRRALKRGGGFELTAMPTDVADQRHDAEELARINDALDELATLDPALVEIVDLRYFCGFSLAEIAELREVSARTIQRQWEKARIYLYGSLRADLAE
jgi:RNA polymerase sigma factor (TIGR02999 family)